MSIFLLLMFLEYVGLLADFEEAKIDVLHIKVVSSRQFTRGRVVAEYFKDYKGD
jgi:hypothetical protein